MSRVSDAPLTGDPDPPLEDAHTCQWIDFFFPLRVFVVCIRDQRKVHPE